MRSFSNLMGHAALLAISLFVLTASPARAQFTEPNATLENTLDPAFQDRLGTTVRIAGNFAFCYSVSDVYRPGFSPGSVQIFQRGPDGWTPFQRLRPFMPRPPGTALGSWNFGRSMIAYEDRLIVGAYFAAVPEIGSGLVACYRRINGRYELEQVISDGPGYGQAYNLGLAMAMHDGDLFVSAAGADIPGNSRGKILRFEEIGGQWVLAEEIIPQSGPYLRVGNGMCFDDGRLIVSVQNFYALVFQNVAGQWVQTQTFVRQNNRDVHGCVGGGGWLHFADADVIGSSSFGSGPGAVTEFQWDGSEYVFQRSIFASDPASVGNVGDAFGFSVARDGNRMVVGALRATTNGVNREGAAYILDLQGGQWVETERLIPSQEGVPGNFETGVSVAIQDDTIVVGSAYFDLGGDGQDNAGAVFVYDRPFGDEVCEGLMNSTGLTASLQVRGSRTAAAGAVRLEGFGLPSNSFALFFAGRSPGFVAMPGGSMGNLCVSGTIGRFGVAQATSGGAVVYTLATEALPFELGGTLQSGETLVFQGWYRDAGFPQASNFTDAVAVTFR